jgi:hypothetical protein
MAAVHIAQVTTALATSYMSRIRRHPRSCLQPLEYALRTATSMKGETPAYDLRIYTSILLSIPFSNQTHPLMTIPECLRIPHVIGRSVFVFSADSYRSSIPTFSFLLTSSVVCYSRPRVLRTVLGFDFSTSLAGHSSANAPFFQEETSYETNDVCWRGTFQRQGSR